MNLLSYHCHIDYRNLIELFGLFSIPLRSSSIHLLSPLKFPHIATLFFVVYCGYWLIRAFSLFYSWFCHDFFSCCNSHLTPSSLSQFVGCTAHPLFSHTLFPPCTIAPFPAFLLLSFYRSLDHSFYLLLSCTTDSEAPIEVMCTTPPSIHKKIDTRYCNPLFATSFAFPSSHLPYALCTVYRSPCDRLAYGSSVRRLYLCCWWSFGLP